MVVGNVAVIDNVAVEMDCSLTMATIMVLKCVSHIR